MKVSRATFRFAWVLVSAWVLACPYPTSAQSPAPPVEEDDDLSINLAEPDFTIGNLPTTLRLPRMKGAFRVTHRFGRPLAQGSFGDLAGDLFGIDSGAQVGLEYRFGLMAGTQIGIYRTSDKTIEFFGQYEAIRQREAVPVTVDIFASVEGLRNFREEYSPALGAIVSRTLGDRAAMYVQPIMIWQSNVFTTDPSADSNTLLVATSGRLRVRPSVYVFGSWMPRAAGYRPGSSMKIVGLERRIGGHSFQLNVSNAIGTTIGHMARGAGSNDDWFLGFNISRKFY